SGRFVEPPDATPNVDFPTCAADGERESRQAAVSSGGTAEELVLAAADAAAVVDRGEVLRTRLGGHLAGLFDARGRDRQIEIVRQSSFHEAFQGLVFEEIPPRQVGQGGLLSGNLSSAKGRRRAHFWSLVIRSHCASFEQSEGGEEEESRRNSIDANQVSWCHCDALG